MSQLRLAVLEEIKGGRSQSPGPAWRPGPSSSQEISSEGGTSSGALETHGLPLLPAQGGCAPPLLLSLPSLLSPFGSCGLSASDTLSSLSWSLSLLVPLLCSSCQPRSIRLPAADHAPWTKDPCCSSPASPAGERPASKQEDTDRRSLPSCVAPLFSCSREGVGVVNGLLHPGDSRHLIFRLFRLTPQAEGQGTRRGQRTTGTQFCICGKQCPSWPRFWHQAPLLPGVRQK